MIKTACPTTLNLPYSEREIKIEGFGGRPPFGGRPGALGPIGPPLNPALVKCSPNIQFLAVYHMAIFAGNHPQRGR